MTPGTEGGHIGDCGYEAPGSGSVIWGHLESMDMWPQVQKGSHIGDCSHVTPDGKARDMGSQWSCGCVMPGTRNGRSVNLETVDV